MASRYTITLKTYGRQRSRWQVVGSQLIDDKRSEPVVAVGPPDWYRWLLQHRRFDIEVDDAVIIAFQDTHRWYSDGLDAWHIHYALRYPGYVPLKTCRLVDARDIERAREEVRSRWRPWSPDDLLPAFMAQALDAYRQRLVTLRSDYIQTETRNWYEAQFWHLQRGGERERERLEARFGAAGRPGHIYIAESPSIHPGLVKIGCSTAVYERVRVLNLQLIHLIETNDIFWAEMKFHFHFFREHRGLEWFALTPDQLDWIRGFHHCDRSDSEPRQAIRRPKYLRI